MVKRNRSSRREFLQASGVTVALGAMSSGLFVSGSSAKAAPKSANEEIGIGAVGLRYQGSVVAEKANAHGNIVAVCDVDQNVRDQACAAFGSRSRKIENYQDVLKRKDVDVVTIGAPDHWHSKMLIDACRAGKDVYCEKPLTLTIDEGKLIEKVVKETGRVVQVGSWQRSDHRFRLAVEMVRGGRIGKLQKVEIVLGKNKVGGPFKPTTVPGNFNWDLWQGQTPDMPFITERAHYTFRWWYEYSGGQMTDWGAHHIDIGQWAIGENPIEINGKAKYPDVGTDSFNVALDYFVSYKYANGVEMTVSDTGRNGIMFTGTEGRIFVNRGTIAGKPVDDLKKNPLKREDFQLYDQDNLSRPERVGKLDAIVNHMGNFFDCIETRKDPVSDVYNQHRSVSTCHLGNISMKVGRKVQWDPEAEIFPGDSEANALLKREQRKGFEVV